MAELGRLASGSPVAAVGVISQVRVICGLDSGLALVCDIRSQTVVLGHCHACC